MIVALATEGFLFVRDLRVGMSLGLKEQNRPIRTLGLEVAGSWRFGNCNTVRFAATESVTFRVKVLVKSPSTVKNPFPRQLTV